MSSLAVREKIRISFSKASETYDLYSDTHQLISSYLLSHCSDRIPPGPVLDLGAGTGVLTKRLTRFAEENQIIALDISESMLSKLRSKGPKFKMICADIGSIPIVNSSIAFVASSTSLQWIEENQIPIFLKEILKPGGVFAIAIILDGTFSELKKIKSALLENSDLGLSLPKFSDIKESLKKENKLELIRFEKHNFLSTFNSMNELLKAIKGLGIGETNQSNLNSQQMTILKERYQKFSEETFNEIALNYEVGFFWGRRR